MKITTTKSPTLWRVEYIGDLKKLHGKRAAIQFNECFGETDHVLPEQDTVKAQFDDMTLLHPETGVQLGFGWHEFKRDDFAVDTAFQEVKQAYKEAADGYR